MTLRPEFVGGFVAAEGTFVAAPDDRRFAFTIGLAVTDADLCDRLQTFFGAGHVYRYPRRRPHHDDVVIFTVQSRRELLSSIVPFLDDHLPVSNKRRQYERWRARLLAASYSPEAAGSSVTRFAQSTGEASDQRRSRS